MISVIVITFNSEKFIRACLDSVFRQDYPEFKVIVVDNSSQDNTRDIIKRSYPQVVLIENKENLGACCARNQGIEASGGDWVLALDCDVTLENNFLSKAINIIDNLPSNTGILQPKILNSDNRTIYSCGLYLSWTRRFYDIGRNKIDHGQYDSLKHIFAASSACAFYRRQMLEDTKEDSGYFDQRFFFLVEDLDLAWRARNKGWNVSLSTDLKSYHAGASCGFNNKIRQFFCFRNRYYSIVKNDGIIKYLLKLLPLALYDIPRIIFLTATNPYIYSKLYGKQRHKRL